MARGRMIDKDIYTSEKVMELPKVAAEFGLKDPLVAVLVYTWLHPVADDFGKMPGDLQWIKFNIFQALEISKEEIEICLKAIEHSNLIEWYEVDGKKYIHIVDFEKHQTGLHHRTHSKFPEIPEDYGKITVEVKRSEVKRSEKEISLHAPRPIAQTAEEIEKLDFVLRLHDSEFSKWMSGVLMLIGEGNKLRPHNPFVWKPTCGSIASDFKKLIYSPPDEEKKKLLYESYNILNGNMNWPEYVKLAIQIMLKASDKKPIHSPYGFVAKLLYKPGDIVSAKTDGPMASLKGRER